MKGRIAGPVDGDGDGDGDQGVVKYFSLCKSRGDTRCISVAVFDRIHEGSAIVLGVSYQ